MRKASSEPGFQRGMGQKNADRVQSPPRIVDGISPPGICSMSDLGKITLMYLYTKKVG